MFSFQETERQRPCPSLHNEHIMFKAEILFGRWLYDMKHVLETGMVMVRSCLCVVDRIPELVINDHPEGCCQVDTH